MFFKKIFIGFLLFLFINKEVSAQNEEAIFANYTTAVERNKLYTYLLNSISKNLSYSLIDSEDKWDEAVSNIELISYKDAFVNARIKDAFDSVQLLTYDLKRALLEMAYSNYQKEFTGQIIGLIRQASEPKIFAMCAEYLLLNKDANTISFINALLNKNFKNITDNAILFSLQKRLEQKNYSSYKILPELFSKDFLANNVVVYSFQRKNRSYPGIVVVRDRDGNFVRDSAENIFSVPQLARSISNLPYYLTNGNTPQGIFRMFGFDVSRSSFIGPTTNIQLAMPAEVSPERFITDSTITDSVWTVDLYKKLLPEKLKNYAPLYESFYAGKAGRTEIISHGTTVDPEFYKDKTYYPFTPTEGCLCTKELWSGADGKRIYSDQQKLVNALKENGGADGYLVVIELDDKNAPVNLSEIQQYIDKAESVK